MSAVIALIALGTLAGPLDAHVISMSSGEFHISGNRARFELRMPLYEIQHVKDRGKALLEHIRFSSRGEPARMTASHCEEDREDGSFRCRATYEWSRPVERFHVVSTLHTITVPNHVHLLHAYLEDKTDQVVLDFSNPEAEVRFRPPTVFELWVTAAAAGFARAFSSPVAVLFLACLSFAARSRRELLALAGMFLLGEALSAVIVPRISWNPAPRFVEAALALTLSYLAVEILLLPKAGQRWAIAGFLGAFHGLSYALFLQATNYGAFPVLTGVAVANSAAIAVFGLLLWRVRKWTPGVAPVAERVASAVLLVGGLAWFVIRLRQ